MDEPVSTTVVAEQTFSFDLQTGLEHIGARLLAALDELFPPLSNLAQAHCRDVQPYLRAAIVLTTWRALEPAALSTDAPTTDAQPHRLTDVPENALLLGSALEMLSVALSIHRLLLLPSSDNTLDKALVGSTILTGDYCFSRAASMAAQTESPYVVELFSRALKQVSEESLRGLFGEVATPHGEDAILATAGVRAMCHLANADVATTESFLRLALLFALHQQSDFAVALADANLSAPARDAWSALDAWRASHS